MTCPTQTPERAELLLAYTSRRMDEQQAAEFAVHAAECPACRELTAAQDSVWRALEAWEAPPVSADFDRKLYRRVETDVSWWDLLLRPLRPVVAGHAMPIATAAILLIAAGLWIERPAVLPVVAVPESAQMEALPPDQAEHALQEMEMMQDFNKLVRADASDPRI